MVRYFYKPHFITKKEEKALKYVKAKQFMFFFMLLWKEDRNHFNSF